MVEHLAHQALGFGRRVRRAVIVLRQRQQRRTAHQRIAATGFRRGAARTQVEGVIVPCRRIDRPSGIGLVRQRQRVTELGQEAYFELAQYRRLRRTGGQPRQCRFVVAKELWVRVFARKELQQQLVQIKAAQQRRPRDQRQTAAPLGSEQRSQLAGAGPGQGQRLECLQDPAQLGARSPRAARDQRDAAVLRGQRLDDQAGLTVGVGVKDERGLLVAPVARLFHRAVPGIDSCTCAASVAQPRELRVVIRPAGLHLDPYFEKHLATEQALHVPPRGACDRLHRGAAFAEQDRAMARLVGIDGRMDPPQRAVVLEAVDGYRRRIRNFLTEQAKDLFAHVFGGDEALVPVGQVVRSEQRLADREMAGDLRREQIKLHALLGADRHHRGKAVRLFQHRQIRQQARLVGEPVDLVDRSDRRHARRQQRQHRAVGVGQFHRLQHDNDRIDAADAVAHRAVHSLVQARAMRGLESRRIDEEELRRRRCHDAEDAMSRRLRLARGDRYARSDQCIDQGRFADIRPTDDGDVAAAKPGGGIRHRSPARRPPPRRPARRRVCSVPIPSPQFRVTESCRRRRRSANAPRL